MATCTVIILQEMPEGAKISESTLEEKWDIYIILKYLPTKFLLTYRKKKNKFIVGKPDISYHLN